MSASVVDIFNWALGAVGNRARVQSPTEASDEAEICALFYENVRDQVLRSAPWSSASAFKRLAQSGEQDDSVNWDESFPAPQYRYMYTLPSDFIWPRYLDGFAQFDLGVNDKNQRVLYTNTFGAVLRYTKRQDRVDLWDADLQAAVAYALAAHICMKLTGSQDKTRLITAQAIDKILSARSTAANAPLVVYDTVPEWISARGYGGTAPLPIFIYPAAEFSFAGLSSATPR